MPMAKRNYVQHRCLTQGDVGLIHQLIDYRNKLKKELKGLTNAALAEKFDVHVRTMDRAVQKSSCGCDGL